jgi:hypothetical protein
LAGTIYVTVPHCLQILDLKFVYIANFVAYIYPDVD